MYIIKSNITKITNLEGNSKRKVPNRIAKLKIQAHQTIGTTVILLTWQLWKKPGFKVN